jgi:hypothetical protein
MDEAERALLAEAAEAEQPAAAAAGAAYNAAPEAPEEVCGTTGLRRHSSISVVPSSTDVDVEWMTPPPPRAVEDEGGHQLKFAPFCVLLLGHSGHGG